MYRIPKLAAFLVDLLIDLAALPKHRAAGRIVGRLLPVSNWFHRHAQATKW